MMKVLRLFAIILLFINGIAALVGGARLIGDPSGEAMGWTTEMLEHSPFDDYLIPGVILFTVNGLLSFTVAFLTIKKNNIYTSYIILQGAVLCGWIISEIMMIRLYHPFHFIFLAVGLLLIVCGYILSAIAPLTVAKT
jgi:hypothetical protein